jgi:molybdopterin-dependent oxidoreductase alpha subunit
MEEHRLEPETGWAAKVPFGLGRAKPKHFRDMLKVAWENRDNLSYAWQVLSRGVCDGCALGVAGFKDWTIEGPHLCMTRLNLLRLNTMPALNPAELAEVAPLAARSNAELRQMGRLAHPMLRDRGQAGFRPISWAEVHRLLGPRLRQADPRRLAFFLTARGITNEVYYLAQKVARFLGTNHVDNAARLCHSPSGAAMKAAIGVGASTCSYRDWFGTDVIVFFGSNPANDQPVATKYLEQAKQRGTKVILVNPYLEPGMRKYWVPSSPSSALFGTELADYWFPVRQGGDIALIYGLLKWLISHGKVDTKFIEASTAGFSALADRVGRLEWSEIEQASGLAKSSIESLAAHLGNARNGVLVWSMGITQHASGADAVRMILNLGLARGWVGRELCGLMPIRGHSSVQGGAEMGAYATAFPGGVAVSPEQAGILSQQYGFPVPDWEGLTSAEMVEAAHRGELDLLYCLGGNFLRTLPDPEYVRAALGRVPVRVHQDIIITDQMLIDAGEMTLLLPAKTRYEQDGGGIETSTERRVMFTPEIPRQVGECKAEWRILRDLAAAAWPERAHLLGCESGEAIREEIARVVPFYEGVQRLKQTGDAIQWGGPQLCVGGMFPTPDGLAHFAAPELRSDLPPPGSFHLSTRRGKQFNTLIYAVVDPLNGATRDTVLISPEDAATLHLKNGDRIALVSSGGRFEGRTQLAPIAPGNLQTHWPEGNVLLSGGRRDAASQAPDYNAYVRIERL